MLLTDQETHRITLDEDHQTPWSVINIPKRSHTVQNHKLVAVYQIFYILHFQTEAIASLLVRERKNQRAKK